MTSFGEPRAVAVNGITLSVIDAGQGPAVLLCHGWPELGHSWRHQARALVAAGFRVVVPDMRGYGASDAPRAVKAYSIFHLVGDVVGLLDALGIGTASVVGHDWGAAVAWNAALMRPDRVRAVAGLSVPYAPRGGHSLIRALRDAGQERFYMVHFQEPGVAEAAFERDVADSLLRVYHGLSGAGMADARWDGTVPEGGGVPDALPRPPRPPQWLPEADFRVYVEAFRRSGFRGGFNWYRNMDRNWELGAPWHHAPIRQPSVFIAGGRDPVLRMPGFDRAVEHLERACPGLAGRHLIDGAGHWVQQEAPEAVNDHLTAFLERYGR